MPKALRLVGYDTVALVEKGWSGMPDIQWLGHAGHAGWLILSCDKKMLAVPSERAIIINRKVGIVYLTTGEEFPAKVLKLLLNKWETLELLDTTVPRSFARFLSPNGRLSRAYRNLRL